MTLARLLAQAVNQVNQFKSTTIDQNAYLLWVDKFQAQLVVLAAQIAWSESVDLALQTIDKAGNQDFEPLKKVLQIVEATLNVLADSVLHEQPPVRRRKLEHLVSGTFYYYSRSRHPQLCRSLLGERSFLCPCLVGILFDQNVFKMVNKALSLSLCCVTHV